MVATFVILAAQSYASHSVENAISSLRRQRLGVMVWVSAIQRFKRKCLDLDGNTKLKSKAGQYGNDSSIVCNAVQFADRKFQSEKFNECYH
jgi:hypothetical protein